MATVKRTVRLFHYLLALFISASFSLVGKTAPSWAQEAKRNYNADIFQGEMQRFAQRSTDVDRFLLKPSHVPARDEYDGDVRSISEHIFADPAVAEKLRQSTWQIIKNINATQPSIEQLQLFSTELLRLDVELLRKKLDALQTQMNRIENNLNKQEQ